MQRHVENVLRQGDAAAAAKAMYDEAKQIKSDL